MIVDDLSKPRVIRIARKLSMIAQLKLRNRSGRSVRGDVPVVVSLTSYGPRMKDVALAIEAIAAGKRRPERMILWVADGDYRAGEFPMLDRLVRRGLEIIVVPDYMSYKKLYPYACLEDRTLPMVTADDDILYPRDWLDRLWTAHQVNPTVQVGLRAHHVTMTADGELAPYGSWRAAQTGEPSFATFFTSGHGIVVLPQVLDSIRDAGETFLKLAPRADDVWLYVHTVKCGIRNSWIENTISALGVPGSQAVALHHENVGRGQNDEYLTNCIDEGLLERIRQDAEKG